MTINALSEPALFFLSFKSQEVPRLRGVPLPVWTNEECDKSYFQPITEVSNTLSLTVSYLANKDLFIFIHQLQTLANYKT